MDLLIPLLVILNIMLGTALFVAKIAEFDRRHARRVRAQQKFKSYFRNGTED